MAVVTGASRGARTGAGWPAGRVTGLAVASDGGWPAVGDRCPPSARMGAVTAARFRRVRWALAAVGLWLGLGLAVAGCGHGAPAATPSGPGPSTTSPVPASAPSTTGRPQPTASPVAPPPTVPPVTAPPTTVWKASAPQASPDAAAATLVNAWANGDRAIATSEATPQAVTTLFAARYPGPGLAISRGCSVAFPPLVCTYGPPGGADPSDAIYEIMVSRTAAGWYVSSVQIQG